MKLKHLFFTLATVAFFTTAQAQVKVGSNPGTISTDAVLDVEGTSGTHTVILQNGSMGIGTNTPSQKLDVDGNARFRSVPTVAQDATFYRLGVDADGVLSKDNSVSSFSTYLGFSPVASTHTKVLPFTLENGYITRLEGTSIGACYGVQVDFTIYFIGTTYLGATLQARNAGATYSQVNLSSSQSIFGTPLEVLANASGCTATSGHTLSFSNGQITDTFLDQPTYYANAGTFVIYNISKVKQTN